MKLFKLDITSSSVLSETGQIYNKYFQKHPGIICC